MRKAILLLVVVVGMGGLARAQNACQSDSNCPSGYACATTGPNAGFCTNLQYDYYNCGSPGNVCPSGGFICSLGQCCLGSGSVCQCIRDGECDPPVQETKRKPVARFQLRPRYSDITATLRLASFTPPQPAQDPPACAPVGTVDCLNDDFNCGAIGNECNSDEEEGCSNGVCRPVCDFEPQEPGCDDGGGGDEPPPELPDPPPVDADKVPLKAIPVRTH